MTAAAWPPMAAAMAAPLGTRFHVSRNASGGSAEDTSRPTIRKIKLTLTFACALNRCIPQQSAFQMCHNEQNTHDPHARLGIEQEVSIPDSLRRIQLNTKQHLLVDVCNCIRHIANPIAVMVFAASVCMDAGPSICMAAAPMHFCSCMERFSADRHAVI